MASHKNKITRNNIVYSTNRDLNFEIQEESHQTLTPDKQNLRVQISKKGRAGKTATVVLGFVGSEADINHLARILKNKCAAGGAVKEGEIVLQGDMRDKAVEILLKEGYRAKRI
ncbi:MAG TPA: translation initiation factor [Bacteroidales bacterium]|nr:translation initiation factor [Bacteroidales bacterium]